MMMIITITIMIIMIPVAAAEAVDREFVCIEWWTFFVVIFPLSWLFSFRIKLSRQSRSHRPPPGGSVHCRTGPMDSVTSWCGTGGVAGWWGLSGLPFLVRCALSIVCFFGYFWVDVAFQMNKKLQTTGGGRKARKKHGEGTKNGENTWKYFLPGGLFWTQNRPT